MSSALLDPADRTDLVLSPLPAVQSVQSSRLIPQSSSIRQFSKYICQKIPDKIFKKPNQSEIFLHERRQSKYLNDPSVLRMLDRSFEEALERGFPLLPPTPQNRSPSLPDLDTKQSPMTPSVEGITIAEKTIEGEEDDDIFSRPSPDLALPTLKELDNEEWKDGQDNVMTLRLTLTPATCLPENEEEMVVESKLGKRTSGLGRILSPTRYRKEKI
jgi:hypothetical protein